LQFDKLKGLANGRLRVRARLDAQAVRGVFLHLLDLGGDIAGNGLSKLFLTIAAAFAEAERDRIRERIGQSKAGQKARGATSGAKFPSAGDAATTASSSLSRPSRMRFGK
jgi:putative DNA-invertase from lambdoid prophage Rac